MAWVKVESSVSRNRKFVKAGPAASWLWVCGLAYCQEGLTDGFIPAEALDFLGVKNARRLSLQLVLANLWDVVEGGWRVHDYLGHNKDAATVRALQQDRREAGAHGGRVSGEARRLKQSVEANANQNSHTDEANDEANPKQPSKPALLCSALLGSDQQSEATAVIARPLGARVGLLKGPRPEAAFDGGRVWVLHKTHQDFLALRHGNERELLAWYQRVAEEWNYGAHKDDEPGANMFKFWEARYAEQWPTKAPEASGHRYAGWQPR